MQNRTMSDMITLLKNNDPHVTFLSLQGTAFTDTHQFIAFCNALVNNQSILSLKFTGCHTDNVISLEPFFIALAHNKKLKTLSFANWPLIKTHLDMLSDALSAPFGKTITELNLSNCGITDNSLSKLNFLTYNRTLHKLVLSNNKINTSGAIELARQLKYAPHQHRSLMALDKNDAGRYHLADATAALQLTAKNISLLKLDLSNNTARKSKYFTWDDVLKNIYSALKKNDAEEKKRHPPLISPAIEVDTSPQDASSPHDVKESEPGDINNAASIASPPANQPPLPVSTPNLTMDVSKLTLPKNLAHQPTQRRAPAYEQPYRLSHPAPLDTHPAPPLFPPFHALSKSAQVTLLGFMSGAGGFGIGTVIAVSLSLAGFLASGPLGWAILAGIVAGCTIGGALIGGLIGIKIALAPPLPSSSALISSALPPLDPAKIPPVRTYHEITEIPERTAAPLPEPRFGGTLYLTEADLRKPKAVRERKIAASTLINSIS